MAQSDESPPAGETTRRARKRETDRRAQREHRQRQKAYVRQLEEVVKDLTAQQSPDDRVVALQAEKARLHARCNALSAKLERIRLAACVDDLQSVEGGKETMHSLPMSPPTTENVASGGEDAYMPFTTSLDPSLTRPQALSDKTALVDLGTLDPAAVCRSPCQERLRVTSNADFGHLSRCVLSLLSMDMAGFPTEANGWTILF